MKKFLFLIAITLFAAGCDKDEESSAPAGAVVTPPAGNVNPEAVGKWLHGTFSMSSFWGYDGSYQGTPFSQSVAFYFMPDGNYEMYYTGQTNYYGCTMDAFSFFRGWVSFTDSSFTIHPTQGNYRGYYACSPSSNFDRAATPAELLVKTYYYEFETDTNGKKWMLVRFDPADQFPSYFAATFW
jgi:hypothetical protein